MHELAGGAASYVEAIQLGSHKDDQGFYVIKRLSSFPRRLDAPISHALSVLGLAFPPRVLSLLNIVPCYEYIIAVFSGSYEGHFALLCPQFWKHARTLFHLKVFFARCFG